MESRPRLTESRPRLTESRPCLTESRPCLTESRPKDIFQLKTRKIVFEIEQMTAPRDKTYKLLGADGKFYQSATKGTLGGHRKDKIYGRLDCKGAARWIKKGFYVKERVFFADEQTAIAAGFRACSRCLPEKYKEWKSNRKSQIANRK